MQLQIFHLPYKSFLIRLGFCNNVHFTMSSAVITLSAMSLVLKTLFCRISIETIAFNMLTYEKHFGLILIHQCLN